MHAQRGKRETYSLSIRVWDIEVPPPSLRAWSGRLAADSVMRYRGRKEGRKEGRRGKEEKRDVSCLMC